MKFTQVLEEAQKEYDSLNQLHTLMDGGRIHIPKNRLPAFNKKLAKACINNNENHLLVEKWVIFIHLSLILILNIKILLNQTIYRRNYF